MKIIIPMAGRGTRLRPHTLTVPKPLVPIAGKPMVQRIVEDLTSGVDEEIEEIAFITGDFGAEVDQQLHDIAKKLGTKAKIYQQDKPLGIAHALLCAKESLNGNYIIVFSDTLFKADFKFDLNDEGVIWVQKVDNPSSFGVVKTEEDGIITDFVEKPVEFVSDQAIVGIYYVRDGEKLRDSMQYLIDNDIKVKGEFQLTSALEKMNADGTKFRAMNIEEWLDCGNKASVVNTNRRMLDFKYKTETLESESARIENSVINQPCYIGPHAKVINSVVGPHVSIGSNTTVENCVIKNSVIQNNTTVQNAILKDSMIGNHVDYEGTASDISIGDFTQIND